jgi:hypothetical protein
MGANRRAEPGWENNIMGGQGGTEVDQRNIGEIIANQGRGVAGNFFARGGVFFGTNAGTGRAMFNNGSGWQPIGNAPSDIRWAPNSGTGNYVASQTAKMFSLLGGGIGGSTGEGEKPVAYNLF